MRYLDLVWKNRLCDLWAPKKQLENNEAKGIKLPSSPLHVRIEWRNEK